jgi:ABC-type multidrug transport system fused ATPase/permease subunit
MIHSRRQVQRIQKDFQTVEGDISGRVADVLRGNRAVKVYGMEEQVLEDFERRALHIGRKSYERDVRSHIEWMKQEGFGYLAYVALMALCAWRAADRPVETGVVVSCFTSFAGLYGPLQQLFQGFVLWGGASAALDRIAHVLDTASTTPEPVDPVPVTPSEGAVELAGITFGYDPEGPVVRDIDLVIPYGQRVAFVGRSGSGKTTLALLALRLYDPQRGEVRIGGTDVRRFSAASLRRHFGVVPQDPFIFRASVRDNVRVARPEATDAEVRTACELAHAWEFIDRLPGRLDASIGEGGSSLSGGQRQRLAIARALLANPSIFVFDEATSALDTLSERLIEAALERSLGGRTAIVIAHRLSTVRHCDRIVVMDAGRIVQDGTYEALVDQGLFAELARGQELP